MTDTLVALQATEAMKPARQKETQLLNATIETVRLCGKLENERDGRMWSTVKVAKAETNDG